MANVPEVWSSNPGIGKKIVLYSAASRLALGPNQPPVPMGTGALSQGLKRQGREADHLPIYSAEVKNGGAIPHSSMRLYGVVLN
jgi:hypothetical protein